MKDAWVIIPVFNRKDITLAGLRHLKKLGLTSTCEILVCDGGSSDGTPEIVRTEFPEIHVIEGNWWWTEAIRAGMQYADQRQASVFIWLNDDSQPRAGSMEKLIAHARETQRVCGGITLAEIGGYTANRRVGNKIQKIPLEECRDGKCIKADSLSGNFVGIPVECVRKIGFPDAELFPHSFGDDDYTSAAAREGYGCDLLPEVEADDMQTSRTLIGMSILRGNRPISEHIKDQLNWKNPRLGWLPTWRFHQRFLGAWGGLPVLQLWFKNWLLIGARVLLPEHVRKRL